MNERYEFLFQENIGIESSKIRSSLDGIEGEVILTNGTGPIHFIINFMVRWIGWFLSSVRLNNSIFSHSLNDVMRTRLLLIQFILFSFLILPSFGISQCHTIDLDLYTQDDIDNLRASLPTGTTCIDGYITIESDGTPAITNLDSLYFLEELRTEINIEACPNLSSIEGLNGLRKCENFYMADLPELVSFKGLENLDTISGDFQVFSTGITRLEHLDQLKFIGAYLTIGNHVFLDSIKTLNNLTYIGNTFEFRGNNALSFVGNFDSLQYVGSSISIKFNTGLLEIPNFNSLCEGGSTGLSLLIEENPELNRIDGAFPKMKQFSSLEIAYNDKLEHIEGFEKLDSVFGNLYLRYLPKLDSVMGFERLRYVQGRFNIRFNDSLKYIDEFPSLETTVDNFSLSNNGMIDTIVGFYNLKNVDQFSINECDSLVYVNDFYSLESAFLMSMDRNKKLTKVPSFPVLHTWTNLRFEENPLLTDYCGIYNLVASGSTDFSFNGNAVNPTLQEILDDGPCQHYGIGSTYYHSLQEAIDEVLSGETIETFVSRLELGDITIPTGVTWQVNNPYKPAIKGVLTCNGIIENNSHVLIKQN